MPRRNQLTPKQQLFIAEYLKDNNGARAAEAAGYSKQNARSQAYQLLNHQPAVITALEEERKKLQVATQYNAERAMAEAEDAMTFALQTENANAYVKAVELRAKLTGLMIERHDVRQAGSFQIQIFGIDGEKQK